jgi:hypothetical protein
VERSEGDEVGDRTRWVSALGGSHEVGKGHGRLHAVEELPGQVPRVVVEPSAEGRVDELAVVVVDFLAEVVGAGVMRAPIRVGWSPRIGGID